MMPREPSRNRERRGRPGSPRIKSATGDDTNALRDLEGLPAAYAAWRDSLLGQITDALEQKLILDLVGPPAGLRILDVGCGDGILTVELSKRGAHATGIDPSEAMIAAARRRAERHAGHASFRIARVEALPFDDASFDVVVAVATLCFVEDAAIAVKEMTRVLKPGGRLVIGELGRRSIWAALRRIRGWLGSPVWRSARFRSRSELERLAADAGLVEVSVRGAIFYPPIGATARLLAPIDHWIGAPTTVGAAFLALAARSPRR